MATPTEHAWRAFAAYLRGPAGSNLYAFTSSNDPSACYRGSVMHDARISVFPEPEDNEPEAFGIVAGKNFTLELADEATDDDWPILDSTGEVITSDDGTAQLVQDY